MPPTPIFLSLRNFCGKGSPWWQVRPSGAKFRCEVGTKCSVKKSVKRGMESYLVVVVVVVVMRSDQPKPPAVAIVRQNGPSSASCRASVAVTPVSRQIWWIQVVGGRPLARLHSCEGRSPSLVLVQIQRIWFAIHHFEVWRGDQTDPVFVCGRCMRRRTGQYDSKPHRWTQSRASWCARYVVGIVHGRNPIFSNQLVWESRSRSRRVVSMDNTHVKYMWSFVEILNLLWLQIQSSLFIELAASPTVMLSRT